MNLLLLSIKKEDAWSFISTYAYRYVDIRNIRLGCRRAVQVKRNMAQSIAADMLETYCKLLGLGCSQSSGYKAFRSRASDCECRNFDIALAGKLTNSCALSLLPIIGYQDNSIEPHCPRIVLYEFSWRICLFKLQIDWPQL